MKVFGALVLLFGVAAAYEFHNAPSAFKNGNRFVLLHDSVARQAPYYTPSYQRSYQVPQKEFVQTHQYIQPSTSFKSQPVYKHYEPVQTADFGRTYSGKYFQPSF